MLVAIPLVLAVAQAQPVPPGPPPPPPVESKQSYDAIDRLAFLEGEWTGTREFGTSHPVPVSWRIGRSGRQDYLLIDEFQHWSDPPRAVFGPRDASELMVLTFDALRGGYRVYFPGFFSLRPGDQRGIDDAADLQLAGATLTWRMAVRDQRERVIRVEGDRLEETLTYLPDHSVIYRTTLTRVPGALLWGERAK